jgi:hypothetical protein
MFRASSCPSSGAQQLHVQPLVYRRSLVIAVLLVVVGPAHSDLTTAGHHMCYKPEAADTV